MSMTGQAGKAGAGGPAARGGTRSYPRAAARRSKLFQLELPSGGVPRAVGAWVVDEEILVDPGPDTTAADLVGALEALGLPEPRAIALTHVHLDHAGATGRLLEHWPRCEVWVDERAAPHLVDPARLLASARRVYGDELESIWGLARPVPAEAIRIASGDRPIGPFDVVPTPGHAGHHLAYLHRDSGTVFTGDAAGVRIPPASFVLTPTVPPEFDPDAWRASIAALAELRPTQLALAHFGLWTDVDEHLTRALESLSQLTYIGRALNQPSFTATVESWIKTAVEEETARSLEHATQPQILWSGVSRYWNRVAKT